MPATWTLTVRDTFSAAHALRNYRGRCENVHGHNYGVAMEVEGNVLTQDTELLVDFHDLKAILRAAYAPLDHADINGVPPFDTVNPSSENLARHLWQRIRPQLPAGVRLVSVSVSEKPEQTATYREHGEENRPCR